MRLRRGSRRRRLLLVPVETPALREDNHEKNHNKGGSLSEEVTGLDHCAFYERAWYGR